LAVIKDSFREALASRVLWILLVFSTVLLLALAPLTLKERRATRLEVGTVFDWPGLVAKLKDQASASAPSPGKRIWELFGDELRDKLAQLPEQLAPDQVTFESSTAVVAELNRIIGDRGLYDEAAWQSLKLSKEATELLERGVTKLSDDDVAALNRLLLEAAFPAEIAHSSGSSMHIAYFGWTAESPLPMPKNQVTTLVKASLAAFMDFFVGTLGVFVAILVTAPIIPHTFEAGAIDLLLSKPVSRSLLFLSKFAGGCAFILVNAAYFVVGLWLIVGFRFEIWSAKLLVCIPVFMFLFAIYYAVSSLAGVVWRNAIVSVVVSILFWAACFAVGQIKQVIELFFINPYRLVKIVPAGDRLLAVNEQAHILEWRAAERKWERVLQTANEPQAVGPLGLAPPMFGPIYDAKQNRVLAVRSAWPAGFRVSAPDPTLLLGTHADAWVAAEGATPPKDTAGLFANPDGEIVIVTRQGVLRADGDLQAKAREFKVLGFKVPLGGKTGPFTTIGPEQPLRLAAPFATTMNPTSAAIAIWNHGILIVLERDEDGNYRRAHEKEFDGVKGAAVLAFAGSTLVAALADGRIWVLDASDLTLRHEFRPEGKNQPRIAEASSDGRWFVVVFHNQKLWLFDATSDQPRTLSFAGRNDITAATFAGEKRLLLADRGTRVIEYELDPFELATRHTPDMRVLERIYRYGVLPIYTVFPKPGELGEMVRYLLTEQETESIGPEPEDLRSTHVKHNVRGPLWSSLAFTVIVLAITCLYIRRTDF
jgi:ABC-type transport system involved in multi-copper enzyme maturation permease subunit